MAKRQAGTTPPPQGDPGKVVIGPEQSHIAKTLADIAVSLRAKGLLVSILFPQALLDDEPIELNDAETLVVAVDDRRPIMPAYASGGHAKLLSDRWLSKGKPPERLFWLDLRLPGEPPQTCNSAAAFVQSTGARMLTPAQLIAALTGAVVPVATGGRPLVFISHASEDRGWAEEVVAALENSGVACWLAYRDIAPGSRSYPSELGRAIKRSQAMLVVVSAAAMQSEHVQREVELALKYKLRMLPFKIDNEPLDESFEYQFAQMQLFIAGARERAVVIADLIRATKSMLGQ